VLKLHQNDIVAIGDGDDRQIMRVVKFGASGQITMAGVNEAGALKARDRDRSDPFSYMSRLAEPLRKLKARQVRVDELGNLFDPGPRA